MSAEEKVNVLMVSIAFQGHVNPLLKLAKRLISKGVHVTFAVTEVARHRMLKYKASTNTNPDFPNQEIQLEFFSDGLGPDFDRDKDLGTFLDHLQREGAKNLSNLITDLTQKGQRYSCVILNAFVPWFVDVAVDHDIPCAILWIQPSAVYSIYYRYFKNIDSFPDLENPNEEVQLPGLPVLRVRDLPSFILPSGPPHFKKLLAYLYQALDKVKWIFGSSFYGIEEETVKSMASLSPIYSVGPLVSPFLLGEKETDGVNVDLWNAEDSCLGWLDSKPSSSVIYVSFGSIIVLPQKDVDNIATALKNSDKAFLWVVKPPEKGSTEPGIELPPWFLEETKESGLVVKWCPQEKVLLHPAVACFISHCGWNSTLETVVAGVPVIAYPKWTDQPTVAKLIADVFRTGVKVNSGEDGVASAEEIERCIREVMDGPRAKEIKKRALEIKETARKSLQKGGDSDNNINQFISELIVAGSPSEV